MGLISYIKGIISPDKKCDMGHGYPSSSSRNCSRGAKVRLRYSEDHDWNYYCIDHSKWPTKDRSRWLPSYGPDVQRLVDGEWEDWDSFNVYTPEDRRH